MLDFLAATEVGKFPPRLPEEPGHEEQLQGSIVVRTGGGQSLISSQLCFLVSLSLSLSNGVHLFDFPWSQGTIGSRG